MKISEHRFTNSLIREKSPYLLQHSHNPVDWFPWKDEVLQRAREEDRLLLISIGYSACHWCHVMERECFENEEIAAVMNRHFINIKIDREERPDVDMVYMQALQLITGQGGWPLNMIALPDGRPVFGGTYFPPLKWKNVLIQVAEFYKKDRNRCIQYAEEISAAVNKPDNLFVAEQTAGPEPAMADQLVQNWKPFFDTQEGGPARSPKFPLPGNFEFLLRYAWHTGNQGCLDYVNLTLKKMAFGGIYDQLGGGFSRYSVDSIWKVPHFEKMLYDNAQLVSLYTHAWQATGNELYRNVALETILFLENELSPAGEGFCSALDADSEGVEGKFYTWTIAEVEQLQGERASLFKDYYNLNPVGHWEHGNYILLRQEDDEVVFARHGLSLLNGMEIIKEAKEQLLRVRNMRVRPGLDDKVVCSWNAMMIKAYVDAFHAFEEDEFLEKASALANFILGSFRKNDGGLWHIWKSGEASVNGFLEDYAFLIAALVDLYSAGADEKYLFEALKLTEYVMDHFEDKDSGYFFFNSSIDAPLFTRKLEMEDNVIPSSNSTLARALFKLDLLFHDKGYGSKARQMLSGMIPKAIESGSSYSTWALLLLDSVYPFYEVVITGPEAEKLSRIISRNYIPNKLLVYCLKHSELPVFWNRFREGNTPVYVCSGQTCHPPVYRVEEVFQRLKNN